MTVQRVNRLDNQLQDTERALAVALVERDAHDSYLGQHRSELERLGAVKREIQSDLILLVAGYHHRPPAYLASLGPCPSRAFDRAKWMEAATAVEDYRHRESITDPRRPLGVLNRSDWQQRDAQRNLDDARRNLGLERPDRSRGIEIEL